MTLLVVTLVLLAVGLLTWREAGRHRRRERLIRVRLEERLSCHRIDAVTRATLRAMRQGAVARQPSRRPP